MRARSGIVKLPFRNSLSQVTTQHMLPFARFHPMIVRLDDTFSVAGIEKGQHPAAPEDADSGICTAPASYGLRSISIRNIVPQSLCSQQILRSIRIPKCIAQHSYLFVTVTTPAH